MRYDSRRAPVSYTHLDVYKRQVLGHPEDAAARTPDLCPDHCIRTFDDAAGKIASENPGQPHLREMTQCDAGVAGIDPRRLDFDAHVTGGKGRVLHLADSQVFERAELLDSQRLHALPAMGVRALATGTIHTAYPIGSRMFAIIALK